MLSLSLGIAGAARKLGISARSLANRVRLDRDGQPLSDAKRRPVGEIEAENSRLRAENATQRMERDVLKKLWSAPVGQHPLGDGIKPFAPMYPAS